MKHHELEQHEECRDGQKRNGDLLEVVGQGMEEHAAEFQRIADACESGFRGIGGIVRLEDEPQQHDGQNGTDGAERNQTEAVVFGAGVASNGADANAQRQNKGHGHRAGRHAAGIKGNSQKIVRHELGEDENQHIAAQKQPLHGDAEQDAQKRNHQKYAHTQSDGQDERHIRNAGNLLGQHLQIRLRDCDDSANKKRYQQNQPQLAAAGHGGTDVLADGRHGQICTQRKQPHAKNQHHCAQQEAKHGACGCGNPNQAQNQHDQCDRKHRSIGFLPLVREKIMEGMAVIPQPFGPIVTFVFGHSLTSLFFKFSQPPYAHGSDHKHAAFGCGGPPGAEPGKYQRDRYQQKTQNRIICMP